MSDPLHVYLLLDVSASMTGAPLEALKQGVHLLYITLAAHQARPVFVSVISYESTATVLLPLTDIRALTDIGIPAREPAGSSALGQALHLLAVHMPEHHPTLVYLFTDGEPTDDWAAGLALIRPRVDRLIGIACGMAANEVYIQSIVDQVFTVRDMAPDDLASTLRSLP